jgi:hypothetical protein
VAQVLVALAAQLSPPEHCGRIVGTLQASIPRGHPAGRLDKKRWLVSSALVFGMLVKLISKENSVRFAFVYGRPNPKLRPQL